MWAHQGPTPHPQIIKQHNDIQPGAGDRIMEDAHPYTGDTRSF
ncbi:DUF2335 domain-containing protein [Corynebacterium kefirresidentii]